MGVPQRMNRMRILFISNQSADFRVLEVRINAGWRSFMCKELFGSLTNNVIHLAGLTYRNLFWNKNKSHDPNKIGVDIY